MTVLPPVVITRDLDDESGETITYTCGAATLYRDYPGDEDRLSLNLGSGEHRRRSELREWAALFAHPAVQDVIAGEDTEPEPAGTVTLRYGNWQRIGGAVSPSTSLICAITSQIGRQNPTLQLTDQQQNQLIGIIIDRVEYLFGLTPGEAHDTHDPTYTQGFIDGFEQGERAGERHTMDAVLSLVEKVERKVAAQ